MLHFLQVPFVPVARFLDRTGMYRTVTLALMALGVMGLCAGLAGVLPYSPFEQLLSVTVALFTALVANFVCARVFRVAVNYESAVITGLIVYFLVLPPQLSNWTEVWVVGAVALLAVVSKFLLAWRGQHVLNPAAAGAVALALLVPVLPGLTYFETAWWLGNPVMAFGVAVVGVAVVAKVRKWTPVVAFLGVGFAVFLFEEWRFTGDPLGGALRYWLSGPSLFLAAFMLTEPFTMPPRKHLQVVYGAFVGVLSQTTLLMPLVKMTPELALCIGNVVFFPATVRQKLRFPFLSVRTLAERTYEFVFAKPDGFRFVPGQYLEWMLPHEKSDSRGIRRYFTIASSPTEEVVRLALRIPEAHSSYKSALQTLKLYDVVIASQLAGDFVLPKDSAEKLAFVAGGIGVTPFRSHLQYLVDTNDRRDVVLYYCNNTVAEIAYREEFAQYGQSLPLRVVQVLAKEQGNGPEFEHGFLTREIIERRTPDYRERTWYLSGPPGMVNAYEKLLKGMGVRRNKIVKDFFPGLA